MEWSSVLVAVAIAVFFTVVLVSLLGWRRPGAVRTESVVTSAVFFFMILFLATWAAGAWISPRGPLAFGVPWLAWLAVALVVTLTLAAVTQPWDRRRSRNAEPTTVAATPGEAGEIVAAGFGLAFWVLMVVLLLVAIAGSLQRGT